MPLLGFGFSADAGDDLRSFEKYLTRAGMTCLRDSVRLDDPCAVIIHPNHEWIARVDRLRSAHSSAWDNIQIAASHMEGIAFLSPLPKSARKLYNTAEWLWVLPVSPANPHENKNLAFTMDQVMVIGEALTEIRQ